MVIRARIDINCTGAFALLFCSTICFHAFPHTCPTWWVLLCVCRVLIVIGRVGVKLDTLIMSVHTNKYRFRLVSYVRSICFGFICHSDLCKIWIPNIQMVL
ncbi:hypothetical protein CLU79DRAFT_770158 [Phycomyces nitens]|nr:hypothetical protein CLU79DRAFT_770158 [Phycomyces nitens]